jgi:hypothetical protein
VVRAEFRESTPRNGIFNGRFPVALPRPTKGGSQAAQIDDLDLKTPIKTKIARD